jgi:hypothetical protein
MLEVNLSSINDDSAEKWPGKIVNKLETPFLLFYLNI